MDFYTIKERSLRNGVLEIYPDFRVGRSKDLMIRGGQFYAIWDEDKGLWSTDEYEVQRLVDKRLFEHKKKIKPYTDGSIIVKSMRDFSTNSWYSFKRYIKNVSDNSHQLDDRLTFSNTEVKKEDYISRRLPYPLEAGNIDAYEELMSTLYTPDERSKLEWAVGAIVSGDAKDIQKFVVLYGEAGSGKSTFLNIVQKLFPGYYTTFDAKDLTSNSNVFATEVFKNNPLIAIQHDGDLSRIEDNTKLNSIISHEDMTMNEKYKSSYMGRINSFLFMATNKPVRITDGKSGIIRRLIDVRPSGNKVAPQKYQVLMQQINFELGAIAAHCLDIYRRMGKNYYATYRPIEMMFKTDVFFNFVEDAYYVMKEQDGISLKQAYNMYKVYCEESMLDYILPMYKFREELKNYFDFFYDVTRIDGKQIRSYYSGFIANKFVGLANKKAPVEHQLPLVLDSEDSIFDKMYPDIPAQYANENEHPLWKWANVFTRLGDLDSRKLHYVQPPLNHIVIDFDIRNEEGVKDPELNLMEASKWPATYAEFSKSGGGIHLHYIYDGDVEQLSRIYDEGIEVKVFTGNSSLRRKLSKCNTTPVATINSGLPLKGDKMLNFTSVQSERSLRALIFRNLNKEIHPGTKPSVDFIYKILEDAYNNNLHYDITDLRPAIMAFANNSTNQASYCVNLVNKMKFKSEEPTPEEHKDQDYILDKLVFYDVEVFPNLFVVCYKVEGGSPVKMINPTPQDIEGLLKLKLVGFNNRRYDNHMLYARYIGYTNEELSRLSLRLVNNSPNSTFGEAYSLSYTDIYDFASVKKSLKKWQLELGLVHKELGLPWDQPVAEELWDTVADYCINDVLTTEELFHALHQDFSARKILSELSGLTVNDTTQRHTAKIIFGDDKNPQSKFVYTDLSTIFPGYTFDAGKSTYRGIVTGEGGYVYAEPGMYGNVAVLDIASMHPTSLILLDAFGPYTQNFAELVDARLAIKRHKYDYVKEIFGGIFSKYLTTEEEADALAYALKIIINIVYGMSSASFDNKFRDPRNKDNIVAKRGALFMVELLHAVRSKGYQVIHIKTDSIKIPDADDYIIKFITDFGKKYGYNFEHEVTYDKMCLINNAVYIAKTMDGKWDAVGAQFAHPYVYKTLFTKEQIHTDELAEIKSVTTALYLDFNEKLQEDEHNYQFIGKSGAFYPVKAGANGGLLMREKEGQYHAANGTKGFRWLEAEVVKELNKQKSIDYIYYRNLADEAIKEISKFGDFEWFVSDDKYIQKDSLENVA